MTPHLRGESSAQVHAMSLTRALPKEREVRRLEYAWQAQDLALTTHAVVSAAAHHGEAFAVTLRTQKTEETIKCSAKLNRQRLTARLRRVVSAVVWTSHGEKLDEECRESHDENRESTAASVLRAASSSFGTIWRRSRSMFGN